MFMSLVAAGVLIATAYIVGKNYIARNVLTAKYCGVEYSVDYDIVPAKIENVIWDSSAGYSLECTLANKTKISIKLPDTEPVSNLNNLPNMYIYLIQITSNRHTGYKPLQPITINEKSDLTISKTETKARLLDNREVLVKLRQLDIAVTAGIFLSILCARIFPVISIALCSGIIYISSKNRNLLNWTKDNNLCIIKESNKGKKDEGGTQKKSEKPPVLSEFEHSLADIESRLKSNLSKRQEDVFPAKEEIQPVNPLPQPDLLMDDEPEEEKPQLVDLPPKPVARKDETREHTKVKQKESSVKTGGNIPLVDVKISNRVVASDVTVNDSKDVSQSSKSQGKKSSRTNKKNKKESELSELLKGVGNGL